MLRPPSYNCLPSFMTTDQKNPFQNAISPNYANYELTHALTWLRWIAVFILYKNWRSYPTEIIKDFYLFLYTGKSNSHAKPKQQAFSHINSFFNGRFLRENFSLQKSSNSSCLYSSVTELRTEHALRCSWKSCMCTRNLVSCMLTDNQLARVFQTLDSATQQINH